ncbi:MAG: ABC transporter ATP-binding protein [Candidatus Schekmanbacteria bacterium]|nr:ABC transporter ATP-binding protein [Candidatus Schekmanbacteria bacterium]
MAAIELQNVTRVYDRGASEVRALRGVELTLEAGSATAVVGPSGSGKSTLLHICGALDTPTSGTVRVLGTDLSRAGDEVLTRFRRDHLGFIFQFFHLLPTLSALENVMIPARMARVSSSECRSRAQGLLERVGLKARLGHPPAKLSGGERQRVAIARSLILEPQVVLADEPTGNLDHETGASVLTLLLDLAHQQGRTVMIVTHDMEVAAACDRIVTLRDGRIDTGATPERASHAGSAAPAAAHSPAAED